MAQDSIRITTQPRELQIIAKKARADSEAFPDDKSVFPKYTPVKNLKMSFLNLANAADGLVNALADVEANGME